MDIIAALHTEIEHYNTEGCCGLAWKFVPGGRSDYFNNIQLRATTQPSDPELQSVSPFGGRGVVYVGVLSIKVKSALVEQGECITQPYCDWQLRLFAGIPSQPDIQFYNEDPAHPIHQGKWAKYLKPLFDCLGGNSPIALSLCHTHNSQGAPTTVEPVRWSVEMRLNYQDYNMDGALVEATFREWN